MKFYFSWIIVMGAQEMRTHLLASVGLCIHLFFVIFVSAT